MSHARMKTVFLHFSNYPPGPFFIAAALENLVFVEFPRFLFIYSFTFVIIIIIYHCFVIL